LRIAQRNLRRGDEYHGRPMASVRAAFDPAVANDSVLELLEQEPDRAPEGIDPDLYRKAVEYSIGRYTRGLPHYVEMVRKIGLTGRRNVIDVGSGAGHWVIALALDNDKVHGVEIREEYVEISRRIASLLGLDNQVAFSVGRGEDAPLADAAFDAACCHGVLMFTDHEAVVRNVGRWLSDGGLFYLGYTTTGSRLHAVEVALRGDNSTKAVAQARMLLAQELYRCGLGRTPGNRVRTFAPEELLRLLEAAGFTEVSRPQAQDGPVEFAGYPATVDFVFRKDSSEPEKARVKEIAQGSEWIEGLDRLVKAGLPETAVELIEATGSPPFELELSEVYVRALVKAQRPGPELLAAADGLEDSRALARGLARHAEWAFEEAYREYAGALEDDPDITFLRADCLLELKQYDEAAELFDQAEGGSLRSWIGRLTVALEQGDLDAARSLVAEFLQAHDA
jgi:SAM-dependent methyltransferase